MQEREREIVFIASPGEIERLPRLLRGLAARVRSRPLRVMEDQYLDTPTRLLMRAGVACRLRRTGRRAVLTLKPLEVFRGDLADPVELNEDLPDGYWTGTGPLPGSAVRRRLLPLARRLDVQTLFTLDRERRVYDVRTRDGAHLTVSSDRMGFAGSARGDGLQHRIEVEPKTGSSGSVDRFVSDLRRGLKLKTAEEEESEFMYGLREAGLAAPVPGAGPERRIQPGDRVRTVAALALADPFRRMRWHVPGARLGVNPERLHDLRVNVRRMRAMLRLFRVALPPRTAETVAAELKWLGQSLGAVRDLDAHIEKCRAMRRRWPVAERKAADACRLEMTRRREHAYEALRRDLGSARFRTLTETCRNLIRRLRRPVVAGGGDIATAGRLLMRPEWARILKDGRAITADTPGEALHRLRIRCKRLRYACETLSDLYGKPVEKMARRLSALQDVLGAHQDAVAAQTLIERALALTDVATPGGVAVAYALGLCAAGWREEQSVRRAAFAGAWETFDRKKARRAFLKAIRL